MSRLSPIQRMLTPHGHKEFVCFLNKNCFMPLMFNCNFCFINWQKFLYCIEKIFCYGKSGILSIFFFFNYCFEREREKRKLLRGYFLLTLELRWAVILTVTKIIYTGTKQNFFLWRLFQRPKEKQGWINNL